MADDYSSTPDGLYIGAYILDATSGEVAQVVAILDGFGHHLRVRGRAGVEREYIRRPITEREREDASLTARWCAACDSFVYPVPESWDELELRCPNANGQPGHILTFDVPEQ